MDPILTPANAWGPDVLRDGAYDQYSLDWGLGGGVTGTVQRFGRDAGAPPEHAHAAEWAVEPSFSFRRGAEVVTTLETIAGTQALLDTVMPELVPDTSELRGLGVDRGCVLPFDALLCSADALAVRCAVQLGGMLEEVLPTRLEVARAALDEAGVTLAVHPGPGLVGLNDAVPPDYLTEGKTASEVVSDMLLRTSPRVWFAPGVMFVDGRELPAGALTPPPAPLVAPVGLWRDEAIDALDVSVTRNSHPEPPDAPLLADFLAECDENAADPCDARTFETMQAGTLEWTESSGSGWSYVETDYRIVKANGHIVSETVTTKAMRLKFQNTDDIPFSGGSLTGPWVGGSPTLVIVEHTEKTNTYLTCCPEALAVSTELTWVPLIPDTNLDTSDPLVHLSGGKIVRNTWHAEGWLRHRVETDIVLDGWRVSFSENFAITGRGGTFPTYKIKSRSERYVPIGNGLWHVDTRINDTIPMPITEVINGFGEIIGARNSTTVNAYTVVTDGGPPTVACGDIDPCNPDETCEARVTRRYNQALAEHQEELAVLAAQAINAPERVLVQSFTVDRAESPSVGDLITTTRGTALVTRVGWSGSGARAPSDSTTVEAWSAL